MAELFESYESELEQNLKDAESALKAIGRAPEGTISYSSGYTHKMRRLKKGQASGDRGVDAVSAE